MNNLKRSCMTLLLSIAMIMSFMPMAMSTAYAAAGDVPDHNKLLIDNKDGTYTLSLDVTGDAEKKPSKANVIVVFDTSSSMNTATGNTEVTYSPTDSTGGYWYQNNLYGRIDDEYVPLSREFNWNTYQYEFSYNGQPYNGQRYTRQEANQSRLQAAESAVNDLAAALLAYNGKDGNPSDTIEMALVDFANMAEIAQQPTTDYDTFEATVNSRNAGNNDRGTNWEAGLRTTLNVNFGTDDKDPTYVIFVSDGNPTFYVNDNGTRGGSGQETDDNIATSYNQAVPAAKAVVDEGYEFYTIGVYGNVTRMEGLTTASGAPAGNYYSAADTAALQAALAEILGKIEMAGIGNVGIQDGTTNQVSTSSGLVELLEVDTTSFKYYRSGGKYGDTPVEWKSTDDPAPPTATFTNGKVNWDLTSLGVLENDVTYKVTFDCYPSQTALDYKARIQNGESYNDVVPEGARDYVDADGNIATNTTATLSYDDTRTEDTEDPVDYTNPPKVKTKTSKLTVEKEWEGGSPPSTDLKLTVLADEKKFTELTLNNSVSWKKDVNISYGLIKDGKVLTKAEGHDFSFAELDSTQYNWELVAPTVHPMIINGTPTMLVKEDAANGYVVPEGQTPIMINGANYYIDEAVTSLKAVNHRRSNLNLKKVVTGDDAPADAEFPFTLKVNNSKADDPNSTDTDSDNYVWFSIRDAGGNYVTNSTVGNATRSGNYYYAKSGAEITVKLQAGWNLRFTNLPTKTTYSFVEGTTEGFQLASAENTGAEDKSFTVSGSTATGTIQAYNNLSYEATFTNNYQKTDLEITKVWDDDGNQDGKRPTVEEFKTYLKLLADGTDVTTANANKLNVEADPDDATKYIVKWTGLDRFASGKEITYTVEEREIAGYTTTGSPAKDGGTITNTHEPEKTTITVKKTWVGPEASGGAVVTLKAGETAVSGEEITNPVTLTKAANNNTYTWQKLDKYAGGKEIEYTVTEDKIENYSTTGPTGKGTVNDPFVFTNTYQASGEATLQVTKALGANSTWPSGKTLTFTLAGTGDVPMPETTTATLSAAGTASFGKITYGLADIGKTYTYTITENGFGTGWTGSPEIVTATVKVTDAGGGKLNADVEYDPTNKTITNTYKATGSATLKVTKALSGAEWPSGEELTVMVTGKTGNEPMPATTSKKITAAGDVEFGPINFTQADIGKTYTYTITESGFGAGWTATPENGITATIVVNDKGDGTLNPVVTYTPGATFTNTYSVNPTSITLSASKTLAVSSGNNPPDVKGKYTFTLKEGNTTIDTKSNPDGNGTAVEFADLTYEAAGEHTYTITESGTVPGVTNGTTEYTVVVNVVDNHDGTLTPSVTSGNQVTNFTNTYSVKPGTASLKVNKALTGRKLQEGEFSFTLTGIDGAPMPETTTVKNDADGEVAFGSISYTAPDTYEYTIAEVKGTDAKITYDEHKVTAKVEVTDDGKGNLVSKVSYEGDTTFKNRYKPDPGEANISVIKELTGRDLNAGEFEFTLDLKDFKPADAEKPETEEPATEDSAVENPSADNPAQEAPAADGPAQEAPAADEPAQEAPAAEAPATNEMDVPIEGTAFKDNSISLKPVAYTEVLSVSEAEQEDEAPSLRSAKPIHLDAKNYADGNVNFAKIEFDEAGTYTFEIKEKKGSLGGVTYDTKTVEVTVEVTYDENTGTFSAEVKYPANKTFENSYEPTPGSVALKVDKKLNGRDLKEGEFSFTLTGVNGAPMPETTTVKNDADGSVTFPAITYKEEGEYKYTIKEDSGSLDRVTYDTHEVKVTVNVTDNKKGKLVPDVSYEGATTFVNTYKPKPAPVFIDPPVQKIIKGSPNKTETYTFMLKADDASYPMPSAANGNSSMTMTIKGTGTKEFGRIYFTEPGEYSYEVSEVAGSNGKCEYDGSIYKVVATVTEDTENNQLKVERKYFKDGVSIDTATFRFENTYESGGGGVDTGDTNDLAGMLGILGASAAGLLYMFFRRRREEDL